MRDAEMVILKNQIEIMRGIGVLMAAVPKIPQVHIETLADTITNTENFLTEKLA